MSGGTLSGSCLCGAIRFTVTGPFAPAIACHCVQCRKSSGHYDAASSAPLDAFRIEGAPRWYELRPGTEIGFCPTCGSSLFQRSADGGELSFALGAIDGDTGLRLTAHIFTAERGDYYDLPTDLPLHEHMP